MSVNDPLRILVLEDEATHFQLMSLVLLKEGVVFTAQHVDQEADFLEQLERFSPDVVLADYRLPDYDGLTALDSVRQRQPHVPVILVSGEMGEELAVEALQRGATDYVLKTNLNRLAAAVRRAVRERDEQLEHRRTLRKLQDSEDRFRRLVELSPDAIFVVQESRFAFANSASLQLFGAASAAQMLGSAFADRLRSEDRPGAEERIRRALREEVAAPLQELQIVRFDGSLLDVESAGSAVAFNGQAAVQFVARDITERRRAQAALTQARDELEQRVKDRTADLMLSNTRLHAEIEDHKRTVQELRDSRVLITAVFASLAGNVAVLDRVGNLVAVNEGWTRFAAAHGGLSPSLAPGGNYLEVCRRSASGGDDSVRAVLTGIESVLAGQQPEYSVEYPCATPEQPRWFRMIVTPLRRPEGGAIVAHMDITKYRQAELQVQRLSQDLAHFGRVSMAGEMAAALAHELRQPLTAIQSNAEAALSQLDGSGAVDVAEAREILTDIVAGGQRAGEVIRRLRSLLRKGQSEMLPLDLNELVAEVIPLVRGQAVLNEITVTSELAPALPKAQGDRIQLEQVLMNLLVNAFDALKPVPRAQRKVIVRTVRNGAGELECAVQDSGSGIPADQLEHIFDSFFTTKADGMGMGLSICRSILQGHGGRLWATNNPDHGATLHFALPLT